MKENKLIIENKSKIFPIFSAYIPGYLYFLKNLMLNCLIRKISNISSLMQQNKYCIIYGYNINYQKINKFNPKTL